MCHVIGIIDVTEKSNCMEFPTHSDTAMVTPVCISLLSLVILETVCRMPVEESGDKSCSSLVSSTDSSQAIEDV